MKKFLIWTAGIIIALLIAMAITNPKAEEHNKVLVESLADGYGVDSESTGGILGMAIAKVVVSAMVDYNDYYIFSLGKFNWMGKKRVVTIGVFGHVYFLGK